MAFVGSKAAEDSRNNVNWRWGFGSFAIIPPFVDAPLFAALNLNLRKAKQNGVIEKETKRNLLQSGIFHIRECDSNSSFASRICIKAC
jgi:hypothetical protein